MQMRVINDKWYTNIWDPEHPKDRIVVSLDAFRKEKRKAEMNYLAIIKDFLDKGLRPLTPKSKIKHFKLDNPKPRPLGIYTKHIIPFFGELHPAELDKTHIENYIEHRFGRNSKGMLHAKQDTIEKEILVIQQLLQVPFGKNFKIPRVLYKKINMKKLPALDFKQILSAAQFVGDLYIEIYWLMALTAIEIQDCLDLRPMDFQRDKKNRVWLDTERSKTGEKIKVPICPFLWDKIKVLPWPLNKEDLIFTEILKFKTPNKATSTAIRRAFDDADLEGYGSKYLRRFIGSILLHLGNSESWIATMLSHAEDSKQTKEYLDIYPDKAMEEFNKITAGVMA